MEKLSWIRGAIALSVVLIIAVFVTVLPPKVDPPFDEKIPPAIGLPLGVMIENELAARPFQMGLSKAGIVYEAPTEGNITRFLAIFAPGNFPKKIGPVRSARPYFIDWMHEYKGVYAHVGGDARALSRLRKEDIWDVDQFVYENYFWRENVGRVALEHTMFTSGEKMEKLIGEKGWDEIENSRWKVENRNGKWKMEFGNSENEKAAEINIDFGFPTYRVSYIYDPQRQMYLRSQTKKPHIDNATGEQLAAKTVVVQRVKSQALGDAALHIEIKSVDSGDAFIFREGRVIRGKWGKESLKARTKFFDEGGREILLGEPSPSEGSIWIEILPLTNSFSFSEKEPTEQT